MNALDLFAAIVAQRGFVRSAEYASFPAYDDLINAELIEESGVVSSVVCDECDQPHDAQVVYEYSQYGFHCPDHGYVARRRADFIAVQPNLKAFVSQIADALACKRIKSTPVLGQTWRVGVVSAPSANVAVYFRPTMRDATDLRDFEAAIARETKAQFGIVLTACGDLNCLPFQTLNLNDCLAFDPATAGFHFEADLFEVANAPVKNKGGRPSPYAENLAKIIAIRKASGKALSGVNSEANALRDAYKLKHPNEPTPSTSAIKRAMSKA